jgi:uncharacterized protein (DUF952 family)
MASRGVGVGIHHICGEHREDSPMDSGLLLHLCTSATWRMALGAGSVAPPSLLNEGFVHLSTPTQVQLPANARFPGRLDLLALVIDLARLPAELRFEPAPDSPADLRFRITTGRFLLMRWWQSCPTSQDRTGASPIWSASPPPETSQLGFA